MGQNPFEGIVKNYSSLSQCVQTYVSRVFQVKREENHDQKQLFSGDVGVFPQSKLSSLDSTPSIRGNDAVPLTKEELGRCSWTVLHMIASQYPERPTRQQKRDAKELMGIISRLYPCKDCADHFKEILSANPVQAGSREEFSQWLCHVHNVVNRSLGKPRFPCQRVNARWAKLDCGDRGCDVDTADIECGINGLMRGPIREASGPKSFSRRRVNIGLSCFLVGRALWQPLMAVKLQ